MRRVLSLPGAVSIAILVVGPARAATLCVNPGGTAGCFASVQGAVDAAGTGDVVDIAAGSYVENVLIPPGTDVTIQGAGAASTIIDGSGGTRVFDINGPGTRVVLAQLTARDSQVAGGTGCGVFVDDAARVDVVGVTVTANGEDGILCRSGAALSVVDSTLSANGDFGLRSTDRRCRIAVARTAIVGNGAGGMYLRRGAKIADSTISGNTGPGIDVVSGVIRIKRSTIAANTSGGIAGGTDRLPTVTVQSTILADNTVGGNPDDCDYGPGRLRSRGYNVVELCDELALPASTDQLVPDAMLGPLSDNGGPSPTHALLPGSPALGIVDRPLLCRGTDQRGTPRPVPCDSGAYEAP